MKTFEVVLKAGYKIKAKNKEEAVKEAERAFEDELFETGIYNFLVDVDGKPYE